LIGEDNTTWFDSWRYSRGDEITGHDGIHHLMSTNAVHVEVGRGYPIFHRWRKQFGFFLGGGATPCQNPIFGFGITLPLNLDIHSRIMNLGYLDEILRKKFFSSYCRGTSAKVRAQKQGAQNTSAKNKKRGSLKAYRQKREMYSLKRAQKRKRVRVAPEITKAQARRN
jgi:hypothetical protein